MKKGHFLMFLTSLVQKGLINTKNMKLKLKFMIKGCMHIPQIRCNALIHPPPPAPSSPLLERLTTMKQHSHHHPCDVPYMLFLLSIITYFFVHIPPIYMHPIDPYSPSNSFWVDG